MFMKTIRLALIFVVLASISCASRPIALSAAAPVEPAFPFPVFELRGDGAAIGAAHGGRFSAQIHLLFEKYLDPWFVNPQLKLGAQSLAVLFEAQLQPRHREEIHALAIAANADERDMMLGNCFLDLSPMTACSTIALPADASPDGVARLGRNLDFPSFNIADKYSVLMIYHPEGKNAFAAVTWPGMIGVLSGMNEHGLTLANMEVTRGRSLPRAVPYAVLYRTILEDCRTVSEAIALLEKSPRQSANNLILMDAAGDRAVVEITPAAIVVRRAPEHAALISTNHHRGMDIDTLGQCSRYDLMHDTAKAEYGRIDETAVKSMLEKVGGSMTLQSMVFEPVNRVILLSVGGNASKGRFYRVELRRYF
jgi:hypothetical protein